VKTLRLLSWEGYHPQKLLSNFEKKYNVNIDYQYIDTVDEIREKLVAGQYDVVMVPDYLVKKLLKENLLSKLKKEQLTNLSLIEEGFSTPYYDPKLEYCVPFSWGTVGVGYNKKYVTKEEASSWNVLFDQKFKGKISMLDVPKELFVAALKSLGYSINTTNVKELKTAKEKLIEQKPLVKMYSSNFRDPLAKEEIWIAQGWNGDMVKAKAANPNIEYSIPKEGSSAWKDNFCVHSKSTNVELATQFINFVSSPEMAALFTNEAQYASPVKGTDPFLKDDIKNNLSIFPAPEQVRTLEFYGDTDNTKFYTETWSILNKK
jgi:spermidine/putrescine transport system substrate-binding protein